jgi:hypothetical protein
VNDREDVVIVTKCFFGTRSDKPNRFGLSQKHVIDACDRSLRRLGVDIAISSPQRWVTCAIVCAHELQRFHPGLDAPWQTSHTPSPAGGGSAND